METFPSPHRSFFFSIFFFFFLTNTGGSVFGEALPQDGWLYEPLQAGGAQINPVAAEIGLRNPHKRYCSFLPSLTCNTVACTHLDMQLQ